MAEMTARERHALDELHEKRPNFDVGDRAGFTAEAGWRVDDYCTALPPEAPGDPRPGGSWETARELMTAYEFADPRIVRAVYRPDSPLEGRDMLLEVRFVGLRFRFGCRVGGVIDEVREVDGRPVRRWGWNYRTLEGHLEMGQMDYEMWKWLDTGDVEFRITAFSKPARIGNPIVRLGFKVFGRRMQLHFAHRALARMDALVRAELAGRRDDSTPTAAAAIDIRPASSEPKAGEHLERQTPDTAG